jgi:peptidoglycan/LPS O-acetylase OafA/YrhL
MRPNRAHLRDMRRCPQNVAPAARAVKASPRARRVRYLREHAVALAVVGIALIALPPVLITPSGGLQLVATGAVTLIGCVLVAAICYESLRR